MKTPGKVVRGNTEVHERMGGGGKDIGTWSEGDTEDTSRFVDEVW